MAVSIMYNTMVSFYSDYTPYGTKKIDWGVFKKRALGKTFVTKTDVTGGLQITVRATNA
jgi:hypothetical protein